MENQTLLDIQGKVAKLESEMATLTSNFYKGNFSNSQVFSKDAVFNARFRVPVFAATPSVGEVGDIFATTAGSVYVCTVAGDVATPATFTLIGSQT